MRLSILFPALCYLALAVGVTVHAEGLDPEVKKELDASFEELSKTVDDGDRLSRLQVVLWIGELGPDASSTIPALIRLGKKGNPFERIAVARTLELVEGRSAEVLALLRSMAMDKQPTVRTAAIRTLAALKDSSDETYAVIVKTLRYGLEKGSQLIITSCVCALQQLNFDVIAVLRGELKSKSSYARLMAALALYGAGEWGQEVVAVLENNRNNEDPGVRSMVEKMLVVIEARKRDEKEQPTAPAPAPTPPLKDF